MKKIATSFVPIQQACAFTALAVRKSSAAGKIPITKGDSAWILLLTVRVLKSYHLFISFNQILCRRITVYPPVFHIKKHKPLL